MRERAGRRVQALKIAAGACALAACNQAPHFPPPTNGAPTRIVSMNLCTDELLMLLARPDEIASLSFLSKDPHESLLSRTARRFSSNYGTIEEAAAGRPDLILTMGGGGRARALIANRLKIPVLELPIPGSLAEVEYSLLAVGKALGDPTRAAPLIARLRALKRRKPEHSRDAIWISSGGESLTAGGLGSEWLRLAGLSQRPLPGGRASIETLLLHPPDVLIESNYRRTQMSSENMWLNHPIVRRAKARRLTADGRVWTCMGPLMIPEIERLRKAGR